MDTFDFGSKFFEAEAPRHLNAQLPFNIQLDYGQAEYAVLCANIRGLFAIDICQRYIGEILGHQALDLGFNGDANAAMWPAKKEEQCRMRFQLLKFSRRRDDLHVGDSHGRRLATSHQEFSAAASAPLAVASGGRPCSMLPRTGREKNVLFNNPSENGSLRFHGSSDTMRAIVQ